MISQSTQLRISKYMKKFFQKLFGGSPIRSKVAKAIDQRLDAVDKSYDIGCKNIDKEAEQKKEALVNEHVDSILKFLQ